MGNTGRCIDHLYIWSGWRTWSGGWCCSDSGSSDGGDSSIFREREKASLNPALTGAAHVDTVDVARSAGKPPPALAAAGCSLRFPRQETLCGKRHKESD